jgi:hypothetical protein
LSPFEAWVISERFGLGEAAHGRGLRWASREHDVETKTVGGAIATASAGAAQLGGPNPSGSHYQRSYVCMGRDCGLSVHRLRQVEKTALDKLRGFLSRRVDDDT